MKFSVDFWPERTKSLEGESKAELETVLREVEKRDFAQVSFEHGIVFFAVYFGPDYALVVWSDEDGNYDDVQNLQAVGEEPKPFYIENGQGEEALPRDCIAKSDGLKVAREFFKTGEPPRWLNWREGN